MTLQLKAFNSDKLRFREHATKSVSRAGIQQPTFNIQVTDAGKSGGSALNACSRDGGVECSISVREIPRRAAIRTDGNVATGILPAVADGIPAAWHPEKTVNQTAEQNLGDPNMMKGNPITILLVEDDPAHAEIVRRNLEGFRVANRIIHVEDGQAALDYLFHQGAYADPKASPRPNLILLDLRLPKVDGLEVLRRVKEDEKLKLLPTVVLTTSGAEADMVNAYTHGVGSYLVKPVDFEKFSKLMEVFGFYWLAWNRFPD